MVIPQLTKEIRIPVEEVIDYDWISVCSVTIDREPEMGESFEDVNFWDTSNTRRCMIKIWPNENGVHPGPEDDHATFTVYVFPTLWTHVVLTMRYGPSEISQLDPNALRPKCAEVMLPETYKDETDYVTVVKVSREPTMMRFFEDVIFIDSDNSTRLKQYQQRPYPMHTDPEFTHYWIKVPFKPASGKKIYMYYGASNAVEYREPDDIFPFWDSGIAGDGDDMDATLNLRPLIKCPPHQPGMAGLTICSPVPQAMNDKWVYNHHHAESDPAIIAGKSDWIFKTADPYGFYWIYTRILYDYYQLIPVLNRKLRYSEAKDAAIFMFGRTTLWPYGAKLVSEPVVPVGYGVRFQFSTNGGSRGYYNYTRFGVAHYLDATCVPMDLACMWYHEWPGRRYLLHPASHLVPNESFPGGFMEPNESLTVDIHRITDDTWAAYEDGVLVASRCNFATKSSELMSVTIEAKDNEFMLRHVMVYKLPAVADKCSPPAALPIVEPGTPTEIFPEDPGIIPTAGGVQVDPPITSSDPQTICVEPTVEADAYEWDFGDGDTSESAEICHEFSGPSCYDLTLTARRLIGGVWYEQKYVIEDFICLTSEVKAVISFRNVVDCDPVTVQFRGTSKFVGVSTYSWDFGDGETSTEQNPVHVFRGKGKYTVSLTVTSGSDASTETIVDAVESKCVALTCYIDHMRGETGTTENTEKIFFNKLRDWVHEDICAVAFALKDALGGYYKSRISAALDTQVSRPFSAVSHASGSDVVSGFSGLTVDEFVNGAFLYSDGSEFYNARIVSNAADSIVISRTDIPVIASGHCIISKNTTGTNADLSSVDMMWFDNPFWSVEDSAGVPIERLPLNFVDAVEPVAPYSGKVYWYIRGKSVYIVKGSDCKMPGVLVFGVFRKPVKAMLPWDCIDLPLEFHNLAQRLTKARIFTVIGRHSDAVAEKAGFVKDVKKFGMNAARIKEAMRKTGELRK